MDFAGKVVLITGASSGIGAASAILFAKASAKLSIVGRNIDNLRNVAEKCETASGFKPLTVLANITLENDVERIVTETINCYGKIDVLVNNAGITLMAGIKDGIDSLDRIMETNIRGTYLLTQKVVPYIIRTQGNIVNVSSILSTVPMPSMMPYCMSKAALDSFTRCLASELAMERVRVNSVNPGPVKTNFFVRAGLSTEHSNALLATFAASVPLKKISESEDVAELIVFLASDKASCITGSCFPMDCGISLATSAKKRDM